MLVKYARDGDAFRRKLAYIWLTGSWTDMKTFLEQQEVDLLKFPSFFRFVARLYHWRGRPAKGSPPYHYNWDAGWNWFVYPINGVPNQDLWYRVIWKGSQYRSFESCKIPAKNDLKQFERVVLEIASVNIAYQVLQPFVIDDVFEFIIRPYMSDVVC